MPKASTDQVRDALLAAASESYTSGGPFSVRDVARRAGVNQGQIHHLFGGKPGLKREMLEALGHEMLAHIDQASPATPTEVLAAASQAHVANEGRFARALARSLLESPPGEVEQQAFPVVDRLLEAFESRSAPARREATTLLAERLAAVLGWALFAPWIRKATRLDDSDVARVEARLRDTTAERAQ